MTSQTTPTHPPAHDAAALREQWSDELRSLGRRVTRQRLAVLHTVHRHQHSTAEEIVRYVRAELPSITVQSVYVVLADLTAIGMLRKFQPPGTPGLYETRANDNHHHSVCVDCGRVEDVDCAVGQAPCLHPSQTHGMQILSADVVFRALCPQCRAARERAEAQGRY